MTEVRRLREFRVSLSRLRRPNIDDDAKIRPELGHQGQMLKDNRSMPRGSVEIDALTGIGHVMIGPHPPERRDTASTSE
jgi:hypothetical protein